MMNVLVTGATGFLGEKLAKRLQLLGYHVTGVGRNQAAGLSLQQQGIKFLSVDLANKQATASLCENIDYVFHCAALSSPWGAFDEFYRCNVLSTENLLASAKANPVKRFIHISTPSIYFDFRDRLNIKEDDPLPAKGCNAYAVTKLMAEKLVDGAFQDDVPVITLRPRGIFGPGDNQVVPRLLKASQRFGIPLINGGKFLLDLTYVENVVDASLLCMTSSRSTLGKKYNITNEEPLYFHQFLSLLGEKFKTQLKTVKGPYACFFLLAALMEASAKVTRREPTLTRYTVSLLAKNQTLDISLAKRELGYHARVSIEEGWKQLNKI